MIGFGQIFHETWQIILNLTFFIFKTLFSFQDMFDMCFEAGACVTIENNQKLIPMTLACVLARRDLFFHILNITREIYWQIGAA